MTTMRAMAIDAPGGPEAFRQTDVPRPVPVNAELLVRVVAAGINPIDAETRSGAGVSQAIEHWPAVLGFDFSGVVVQSPYESHPLQPGTEVFGVTTVPRCGGSYAEYVVVPALSVVRKPPRLSHVQAAAVPFAALTAWGLVVDLARAHDGQRMLVHGASGGVGHFAVQFATYFGSRVTATTSTRNVEWVESLGAIEVIDYTAERFEDVVSEVDVVIDLIGNVHEDTGTRSLPVLRRGGLIVNAPTGSWPTFLEEAAERGVRATTYQVAPDGAALSVIARLLESGDVRVHVDEVLPLCRAAEAHLLLERGHTRGKIVLVADA